MKSCIILGDRSDIAIGLRPFLEADGYAITGWNRETQAKSDASWPNGGMANFPQWDLILCAIGRVSPVGHWSTQNADEWDDSVHANCLLPIRLVRALWSSRKPDASVCFLAGANPNRAGPNYSAYYTGKMALLKAIETIDAETPEAKFFALAPGIVFTKIHKPTEESGIVNEGLEARRKVGGTPMENIYGALKWCVKQDKATVGGRNICVSDLGGSFDNERLAAQLCVNISQFKLRREK